MPDGFHPDVCETARPRLGARFAEALRFAEEVHHRQTRKGTEVPYFSHLISVAALVLEAGGDEDLAIAALLHDAPEDQGGEAMLAEIHRRFGARVAEVVNGCTDTFENPKPDWCTRKQNYITHIRDAADLGTCVVSAADKIHNARSIVTDHYKEGDEVFERFKGRKDRTVWYYRQLVKAFHTAAERNRAVDHDPHLEAGLARLTGELERIVCELEARAGKVDYDPCRE